MKTKTLAIPAKRGSSKSPAIVSSFKLQSQGALLCGLLFADQSLWKVELDSDAHIKSVQNMDLESFLGEKIFGVIGGLQPTVSGDMAFSVLHPGIGSGALSFLSGGSLASKSADDVKKYIFNQEGGLGLGLRHSILQYSGGGFSVRRSKEPGSIIDVYHLGDYVFGLHPKSFWKEPYLKTEKREVLRSDLLENGALHRSEDGTIWFVGKDQKLYRFTPADIKALPTTQKLKSGSLLQSAASPFGSWLFGLSTTQELFRVRKNPVNGLDELEYFKDLPGSLSAIAVAQNEGVGILAALVRGDRSLDLWVAPLKAEEDEEDRGPLPEFKKVGSLDGAKSSEHLQVQALKEGRYVAYVASDSESGPQIVSAEFKA